MSRDTLAPAPCRIDICVVLVNWNTRDLLLQCLASVRMQELAPLTTEIIVIDNASTDTSVQSVRERFSDVTLLENPYPMGFTKAANRGFALSRGRYVLLTQPDVTMPESRSVATMAECLDHEPDVAVVTPRYVYPDGSFQRMYNDFPGPACMFSRP